MTVVITGTFRVPPEKLAGFKPQMQAMLDASRAEDGCNTYAYSLDLNDPGLIWVTESWRDSAALAAHAASAHMQVWIAARTEVGAYGRDLTAFEVASERKL
jgi:quinol monooxygenase YgiN